MAKKSARVLVGLVCSVCKQQNYVVQKNKTNTTEALVLQRYCNKCMKHTEHKEKKKLS